MSSNIEWTDATWNPVVGCTPVSPGCLNCYAATMARRLEAMGKAEYQPRRIAPDGSSRIGHVAEALPSGTRTIRIAEVRGGRAVFTGEVRTVPDRLILPLKWRKPRMVFVNSMSDLFHEAVPFEFIDRVFAVMASCGRHTFQILTKRPERMAEYLQRVAAHGMRHANLYQSSLIDYYSRHGVDLSFEYQTPSPPTPELRFIYDSSLGVDPNSRIEDRPSDAFGQCHWRPWPLSNVWLGTSVENQAEADKRIPHLLRCPAAVRFLSCEPLLGPLDLTNVSLGQTGCTPVPGGPLDGVHTLNWYIDALRGAPKTGIPGIDWVIVGGESGANARPCDVAWIRSIVGQCKAAGVACFVKQLGARFHHAAFGIAGRLLDIPPEAMALLSHRLRDLKGGDPDEWPKELRVREMPGR